MTTYTEQKILREQEIANAYDFHIFAGCKPKEAEHLIMLKYKIFARSTVWAIRKRVAEREKEALAANRLLRLMGHPPMKEN